MKTIAMMLLLSATCASATARTELDRQSYCASYGEMFQTIAAWHQHGSSPADTLRMIVGVKGISPQQKKDAVNAIYADTIYKGKHGPAFGQQIRQDCLNEKSDIQAAGSR
jgi:hypothetical protein